MTQATNFGVPTTGPASPDAMAARIQNNLEAALTGHSGPSRPSYAEAGTIWQDTSVANTVSLYFHDGTHDILIGVIDTANNRYTEPAQAWADLASATTTDIGSVTSQNVRITGTNAIASLGMAAAGTFRRVRFTASLRLIRDASSLILPGAADIVTVAGDVAEFISEGSGNWRCVDYQYAEGSSGFRHIATIDITSSTASMDVAIPSWARQIRITGYGVPETLGASILLRMAVSGVINSTAGAYLLQFGRADGATLDGARDTTSQTGFTLLAGSNNGPNGGGTFNMLLSKVNQPRHTYASNRNAYLSPGGNIQDFSSSGIFISTSQISGIRLLASAGGISILHANIEASR